MICQNGNSLTSLKETHDVPKQTSNYINNNYNNIINLYNDNLLKEVKDKCKLNEFNDNDKLLLESIIDMLYNSKFIKVNGITIKQPDILNKLKLINRNNLIHLLDVIKNSSNIKNLNNYLMITLYNNLGNNYNKNKSNISNFESREYSKEFLESFYCNS